MTFPLSGLLYYDLSTIKHGKISKAFKEYRLLLNALIESINAFEAGELEKFDSLVGENACQIRAIRIALIHTNQSLSINLKNIAAQVRDDISKLLTTQIRALQSGKLSLKEIFEKNELELFLNKDDLFTLKSYILSEAKESLDVDSSDPLFSSALKCSPNKIQRFESDVSCNFAGKLTNRLRRLLSISSTQFVQQTAFNLADTSLIKELSDDFLQDHNTLSCLPMFWTYKALLKFAKINEIPLIVRVKLLKQVNGKATIIEEKSYFFMPLQDIYGTWQYQITVPTQDDLTKAACIIEGVADCSTSKDWNEEALTSSIINAILAGAADHRQYPNSNQTSKTKNLEYLYFKSIAQNQGFSLQNKSSFFIHHVYTMQVNKVFSNGFVKGNTEKSSQHTKQLAYI